MSCKAPSRRVTGTREPLYLTRAAPRWPTSENQQLIRRRLFSLGDDQAGIDVSAQGHRLLRA
jgi:hypothetical protein